MLRNNENQKYVIGVDGGGTKTTAILADLNGKILARAETGSSHPRNLGFKKAVSSIVFVIKKVLEKIGDNGKICAVFLGLPAMEEEFKLKKNIIRKELLKYKEIVPIFNSKIIIGSDQLVGFRSGTEKKEGIILIAGFGCVCHGWRNKKEAKIDGWGYLSEMGSAFFVGQETLKAIFKSLDGRSKKTLLTKFILGKLKVRNKEELANLIYSKTPMEIVSTLAIYCNLMAEKGDKTAKKILISAGQELALSAKVAIKRLRFEKRKFPLVLVGSMFDSKILLDTLKKDVRKFAAKVEFIRPKAEPAIGAVKLAIKSLISENN